ncbi:MAG: phenylacetate--CoA ligase, partial [Deltaproteobacteria bacterium]
VNMFPSQIEKKLMEINGVGNNFLIILSREGFSDVLTIKVEHAKSYDGSLSALKKTVTEELKSDILITPKIDIVAPNSLPQTEGKAIRVIDERKD